MWNDDPKPKRIFTIEPSETFRLGDMPLVPVDNISSMMNSAARLALLVCNQNWCSHFLKDHTLNHQESGTINLCMKQLSMPIDNDETVKTDDPILINDILSKGHFERLTVIKDAQNGNWDRMVVLQEKKYKVSHLIFSENATNPEIVSRMIQSFDPIHLDSVSFSYLANPVNIFRGQFTMPKLWKLGFFLDANVRDLHDYLKEVQPAPFKLSFESEDAIDTFAEVMSPDDLIHLDEHVLICILVAQEYCLQKKEDGTMEISSL
ncbi:hypothetical protein CAEBREN_10873 [Caenorhabditis brenneri]|uniref:Uncharacterized protein n=1 Tax=Caenorhabditis brenneri TaxID=135651 RepID=G0MF23_CAEBE|nr:hypothetical protein CAEBREN_10873 [Caenorhabditis brenneri]